MDVVLMERIVSLVGIIAVLLVRLFTHLLSIIYNKSERGIEG
jgi:hypothetical protein